MTLYEVVHGVAFAQAFNFYMQQQQLIPPGALNVDGRIAFIQDLEAAQQYALAQADLVWVRYQRLSADEEAEWGDETTNTYIGRDLKSPRVVPLPPVPVSQHLKTTVRAPPNPHNGKTVRIPPVRTDDWRNSDAPLPPSR